jgi:DNA-binding protein HU-beta
MASRPATKAKVAAPEPAAKKPGKPVPAPAKKPVAAPKKAAETVTLKTVFEQLGETHGLPRKQTHGLLTDFVATVTSILKSGDRVRMKVEDVFTQHRRLWVRLHEKGGKLSGLGIIEVKDRPAHMGRNPATGEAIQIAASKKVAFRAAKELKEAV